MDSNTIWLLVGAAVTAGFLGAFLAAVSVAISNFIKGRKAKRILEGKEMNMIKVPGIPKAIEIKKYIVKDDEKVVQEVKLDGTIIGQYEKKPETTGTTQ